MLVDPFEDDDSKWLKTLGLAFATALVASIATEGGKWAVEHIRKRVEKKDEDGAKS